ncbi:phosphonate C-P lyase system protein PhnH [Alkalihalobacillus oceani]|uniref:Phosphonate C-P lyase system protein PhnH n=1 Tax=Halalkalibacter oceani TaxID=1653776 RepID=A0A9X2DNY3_9BACI|nr:phosphonate C-P lyase system protein PhnH [Halalkalibacter oceani]MCM3714399.1 phosphonate C-P lyase system protein PhnH [Halalkalibacter oceani]
MVTFDYIHDIQTVYRKVVNATSRPGQLADLAEEVALLEEDGKNDCPASFLLLALTLFDQEVTFAVMSKKAEVISKILNQFTYAKPVAIEQADYILILQDAGEGALQEAIGKAKSGTLRNPHTSASLIVEVEKVSNNQTLQLKGPGIRTTAFIDVKTSEKWLELRQMKNREYPLGVDFLFIDQEQQLLSLPRTTQISENRVIV